MRDPIRDALDRFAGGDPIVEDGRWIVRIALALVMVGFGADKFVHPAYWPMWVPDALWPLATPVGIALIGALEVGLGAALLAGRAQRVVALATAGYLTAIVVSQGPTLVALRDLGLAAAAAYLGLTASGAAVGTPRRLDLEWPTIDRGRAGLVVGLLVAGLVAGGVLAVAWSDRPQEPTGDLLAFVTPEDGDRVEAGTVPVEVALRPRVHELGVDHMHLRVDGGVVGAVYFGEGQSSVETSVDLEPGERTVGAYLAYTDHVEYEDSWTAVRVTAT